MNKITRFLSLCCAVAVLAGISGAGVLSARASTDNGQLSLIHISEPTRH